MFALGALAYYVLAGRPAAADRAALRERLHRDGGLDLAADLPQVPPAVRALVLDATRPAVTERLPDVRAFLDRLAEAEQALAGPAEDVIDPLEAAPGAVIDGRFRLQRRLGAGSTAVGLLVTDLTRRPSPARTRPGCSRSRSMTPRPGGWPTRRRCSPGCATRGWSGWSRARSRSAAGRPWCWRAPVTRPSARCCAAGNGCRWTCWNGGAPTCWKRWSRWTAPGSITGTSSRPTSASGRAASDRAKHLVLFDFSLSRAGATAVTAGTPPYLDPFLDDPGRGRYDSAAERYSAAVVLFEMATGSAPAVRRRAVRSRRRCRTRPRSSPACSTRRSPDALAAFFRTALARNARQRHDTAADMLAALAGRVRAGAEDRPRRRR